MLSAGRHSDSRGTEEVAPGGVRDFGVSTGTTGHRTGRQSGEVQVLLHTADVNAIGAVPSAAHASDAWAETPRRPKSICANWPVH